MNIALLLFVIAFNIFQTSVAKYCWKDLPITVFILNNLPPNSPPLKLRCQSKDDDLGYHTLWPHQDFHWTFCQNIFGKTLFFCHLYWGSKQRACDVFRTKWVNPPRFEFWWSVTSDGIYSNNYNDNRTYYKTYEWN
ncbi:hypothetical protein PHJA_000143800 [Phtheirospermum japonicum]|uniref:S-protein homolog n=1 Tax=Phtheirospermum japonicum TaxID=374723 RepID=A0A830B603_9LAMI|nr:hypothetical protein PHJA_000143800 [Phtheirospermum japonicum]